MSVPTGSDRLDAVLGGGLPAGRAAVVTGGGPGLGKSTFAMQVLQTGLDEGETGLFISTEQRVDELEASFEGFAFDLDHPNLTVASVVARADGSLETEVRGADAGPSAGFDGFPTEADFPQVADALAALGPADRVAYDSVSGLGALDEDPAALHRHILSLIRLFTDRFDATSVLTAEDPGGPADGSERALTTAAVVAANGAVRLEPVRVRGSRRRILRVVKFRGVDHPVGPFEFVIGRRGLQLVTTHRSPASRATEPHIGTGSDTVDAFTGGGLVVGDSIVVEHDERSLLGPLVVQMASGALDAGMGLWLVPAPVLTASRFDDLLPPGQSSVSDLLTQDRLFVLDLFSGWERHHDSPNVYTVPAGRVVRRIVSTSWGLRYAKRVIRAIDRQRAGRPIFAPVFTKAFSYLFDVRDLYYWARNTLTTDRDTALYVHNPAALDPQLAETFRSEARQTFALTTDTSGLQYLELLKSPDGSPGSTAVVDFGEPLSLS